MKVEEYNSLIEMSQRIDFFLAQIQTLSSYDYAQFLQQGGIAQSQTLIEQVQYTLDSAAQLNSLTTLPANERQDYIEKLARLQEALTGAYSYLSNCRDQIKGEISSTRAAMQWSSTMKDLNP